MLNLKQLAYITEKNQSELGHILGVPQSAVSYMMNGFRRIRPEHIRRLKEAFGDSVVESCMESDERIDTHAGAQTVQATILHRDIVEDVSEELRDDMALPNHEDVEVIESLEAIPILSPDQVKSPNFDVKSHVDNGSDQIKRLPIAQILAKFGEFEVVSPTYRDSMIPAYMPGDFLFVQYKQDWNPTLTLKQGIYLIDTTIHGSILCMIEDMEDGRLRLTFKNSKKYKPMVIPKDIVLSVATVSFFIRMGDMAFDVEDTAYLQHLLDCQIDQYNQLMVQYGRTGDRVDRIISQNELLISNHERIIDALISEKKK